MNARRLVALVRDRIEEARMRRVIRRVASRAPFDDARQRASDTANCAIDDQAPGTDDQELDHLNRLYDAPSWEGK